MHLCIASLLVTALLLYVKSIIKLELFFLFLQERPQKEENESLRVQFTSEDAGLCASVFVPSPRTHTRPLCRVSPW